MIWLTYRQFRTQAIAAAALLAALAIALVVTGPNLLHIFETTGVASCHGTASCDAATTRFANQVRGSTYDELLFFLGIVLLYVIPGLIGVFWGAPLMTRELEAGTLKLAWTQGVTRTRWLLAKLGLLCLAAMATTGLLSLMVSWWASPIYRAGEASSANPLNIDRFGAVMFGANGIAPLGYAAFAFGLGVVAGVFIKRTVPAMAVTLGMFAATQIIWPRWIRPNLLSPLHKTSAFDPAAISSIWVAGPRMTVAESVNMPGGWVLSQQTLSPNGTPFTGPTNNACITGSFSRCQAWLASKHLQTLISYQPASRYWTFQWLETSIFLAMAVALLAVCFWRVGRASA